MPPPSVILFLAAKLLVIAAVLLAPWPGIETGYSAYFRFCGNTAFSRFWFWPDASVRFLDPTNIRPEDLPPWADPPAAQKEKDTVMVLENRKARGDISFLRTSSRLIGYWPAAMMLALVLSTPSGRAPVQRRFLQKIWGGFIGIFTDAARRWKGLLLAMVLVHLFILIRVSLHLAVDGFTGDKAIALFHPSPFWAKFWVGARTVLNDDPPVSFVAPCLIWVLLFFRPSQWSGYSEPAA